MNQPQGLLTENLTFIDSSFHSPLTDKVSMLTTQQGAVCGLFEAQYFKCMEAFGAKLGRLYCDLEYRDFRECMTKEKHLKRVEAMRQERYKQYVRGERKDLYENYLTFGDINPNHGKWDQFNIPSQE